jgi:hypothetical protein
VKRVPFEAALRELRDAAALRNPALRVYPDADQAETIVVAVVNDQGAGRVLRRLDAAEARALAQDLNQGRGLLARIA